jgi:hypothetical protein
MGVALAFTPADELLDLPFLNGDAVPNSMVAYMIAKRANHLRVQAEAITWGARRAGQFHQPGDHRHAAGAA